MSWRLSVSFAVAVSAGAMGIVSSPVRADEAYLCGPDRIVYVAVADLEMKKRTDPCIAAYYGLKVDEPAKAAAAEPPLPASAKALPVAQLKVLSDADVPQKIQRTAERHAALEPPRPSVGTDYRNVKILNAAAPDAGWYRHTK